MDEFKKKLLEKIKAAHVSRLVLFPKNATSAALARAIGKEVLETSDPAQAQAYTPTHIAICADAEKTMYLLQLNKVAWKTYPEIVLAGTAHQNVIQKTVEQMEKTKGILSHATGYAYTKAHIYEALQYLHTEKIPGCIIELGSFKGGTLLLMHELCAHIGFSPLPRIVGFDSWDGERKRHCLLDLFDMHTFVASARDMPTKMPSSVELIKGDITKTIPRFIKQLHKKHIALVFIDTDNYFAVREALPLIYPVLAVGGIIIFDHYYTQEAFSNTIGEHIAMQEFLQTHDHRFLHLSGTGVFIKIT